MKKYKAMILSALLICLPVCSGCADSSVTTQQNVGESRVEQTHASETDNDTISEIGAEPAPEEIIPEMPTNFELFSGTDKDESPLNTINNKEFSPSVFCFDNDTVFFSWKGSVYSYNEIESTLEKLFEAYAYSLNYYNGKIYYIENNEYAISRDTTLVEGPLFCYDLTDKSVTKICDRDISMPVVCDNGIFYVKYSVYGDSLPTGVYKLNEESGLSERICNGFSYIEYNDLVYSYIPGDGENDEIRFYFSHDDTALMLDNIHSRKESLLGDNLYYVSRDDGSLNRLSMLTGENTARITYSDDFFKTYYPDMSDKYIEQYSSAEQKLTLSDYTVFGGDMWFYGIGLNRYIESKNEIISYSANFLSHSLYSSNNAMYAVISQNIDGKDVFRFAKIKISGNTAEAEIIK